MSQTSTVVPMKSPVTPRRPRAAPSVPAMTWGLRPSSSRRAVRSRELLASRAALVAVRQLTRESSCSRASSRAWAR